MKLEERIENRAYLKAVCAVAWFLVLGLMPPARAHIGSPNVFFEGYAGPYPIRVVIRPPGVIPGLAEISVRVHTNGVERVTALPIRWNTGRQGAPRPDEAKPVRGETNLFNAELWFMRDGAQSVEVEISGNAGRGQVIVPVNAIATRVLEVPGSLGKILAALGLLLFALLVSIVGTAVRESVLPAGQSPSFQRLWGARCMMAVAALSTATLLWLGKRWWDSEANDYRNNRLYRPLETTARIRNEGSQRILELELADERFARTAPLVPDHGKLMHLFLVQEPALEVFAHLHPIKRAWNKFEVSLPKLPAGSYRIYADVTYETGQSDTLTTPLSILEASPETNSMGGVEVDSDDAWVEAKPFSGRAGSRSSLSSDYVMDWLAPPESIVENHDVRLRFVVRDKENHSIPVEPYMGMLGHLILRREDGSVFTHLHPSGSFSMAAQQLFELRVEGKAPLKAALGKEDPICTLPSVAESQAAWLRSNPADSEQAVTFPYSFPMPGKYRLWTQVKVNGQVLIGVFDAEVSPVR